MGHGEEPTPDPSLGSPHGGVSPAPAFALPSQGSAFSGSTLGAWNRCAGT